MRRDGGCGKPQQRAAFRSAERRARIWVVPTGEDAGRRQRLNRRLCAESARGGLRGAPNRRQPGIRRRVQRRSARRHHGVRAVLQPRRAPGERCRRTAARSVGDRAYGGNRRGCPPRPGSSPPFFLSDRQPLELSTPHLEGQDAAVPVALHRRSARATGDGRFCRRRVHPVPRRAAAVCGRLRRELLPVQRGGGSRASPEHMRLETPCSCPRRRPHMAAADRARGSMGR